MPHDKTVDTPSAAAIECAEVIASDCGISGNNTTLVARIAGRIDAYADAQVAEMLRATEFQIQPDGTIHKNMDNAIR